jgi:hypothetical protein
MHPSRFAASMLAGAVAFFCGEAQSAPLPSALSPTLSLVVQAGWKCRPVNGKRVCRDTKSQAQGMPSSPSDETLDAKRFKPVTKLGVHPSGSQPSTSSGK